MPKNRNYVSRLKSSKTEYQGSILEQEIQNAKCMHCELILSWRYRIRVVAIFGLKS